MTKIWDWELLDNLMTAGCKGTECAAFFGVHPDTLYNKVKEKYNMDFSAYLQQKHANGAAIIRAHQYAKALGRTEKGDNSLLIWLGKQRLDQRDNREESKPTEITVKINNDGLGIGTNFSAEGISKTSDKSTE